MYRILRFYELFFYSIVMKDVRSDPAVDISKLILLIYLYILSSQYQRGKQKRKLNEEHTL